MRHSVWTISALVFIFVLAVGANSIRFNQILGNGSFVAESNPEECPAAFYGEKYPDDPDFTERYAECSELQRSLGIAASEGDLTVVQNLVKKGANVNGSYSHQGYPLMLASMQGRAEVVEFLLVRGSDKEKTALWRGTAIVQAVIYNRQDVVRLLIDHGADVCIKFDNDLTTNLTPLRLAKEGGFKEIEILLIDAGADRCGWSNWY